MKMPLLAAVAAAGLALAAAQVHAAPVFGAPAGWTGVGAVGTGTPNGNVGAIPGGHLSYQFVTTAGGATGGGNLLGLGNETDGSRLTSPTFTANVGDALVFWFNYVTSDGAGFADYSWARLLDAVTGTQAALLFTARTVPAPGNIVPGTGMPAPDATLDPAVVSIILGTGAGGGPVWAELGGDSGSCWAGGCGLSGWVKSTYTIGTAGSYQLEFGVTNWVDNAFDSGMAIAGAVIGDRPIGVPEPASLALVGLGLGGLMLASRRRRGA